MSVRAVGLKLRTKALWVLSAAVIFSVAEVVLALNFKADLLRDFDRLDDLRRVERDLELAQFHTNDLQADLFQFTATDDEHFATLAAEGRSHLLTILDLGDPVGPMAEEARLAAFLDRLGQLENGGGETASRETFVEDLNLALLTFDTMTEAAMAANDASRDRLSRHYHHKSDRDALIVLVVGIAFFMIAMVAIWLFISRLITDLKRLAHRAGNIRLGEYGQPLSLGRSDEVGELSVALDEMAAALEKHEQRMAEFQSRLGQQEKMFAVGTFAAGIAHDLGNPLQAIVALIADAGDTIREEAGGRDMTQALSRIDLIAEHTERLSATLRDLNEFSSPTPEGLEPVSLNDIAKSTLRLLRFDPRAKQVALDLNLGPDLPLILASADQLVQVVMNLLLNAADALEGGKGDIRLETGRRGNLVWLSVEDSGIGMSEEVRSRAFEPFFTTKPRGQGTGLGLAVCKTIIDDHGGTLEIESEPGEGTSVSVLLPIAKPEAQP